MDKFRVGQKVLTRIPPGWSLPLDETNRRAAGQVTFIAGPGYVDNRGDKRYPLEYRNSRGTQARALESALIPLYDGDEPASWETCAWRPRELSNVPA